MFQNIPKHKDEEKENIPKSARRKSVSEDGIREEHKLNRTVSINPHEPKRQEFRPILQSNKQDVVQVENEKRTVKKKESISLPPFSEPNRNEEKPKRNSLWNSPDIRRSLQVERLHLTRKSYLDELEEDELEKLVEAEMAAQETLNENRWWRKIKEFATKSDVFAAAHTMPKHQVCIYVATVMIPLSILCISWDVLATEIFQIPHLSTINAPGFILFINFIAMPLAMYGYMMEYLMFENSRLAVLGLICAVIHPVLFFIRAFMEYNYDGYRSEEKLYFENHDENVGHFEYPQRVLSPLVKTEIFLPNH